MFASVSLLISIIRFFPELRAVVVPAESDGVATFQASILPEVTGLYQVATRVYPKHADLPHRQDFPLVKWL